jgi:bacteriocin-like protein
LLQKRKFEELQEEELQNINGGFQIQYVLASLSQIAETASAFYSPGYANAEVSPGNSRTLYLPQHMRV